MPNRNCFFALVGLLCVLSFGVAQATPRPQLSNSLEWDGSLATRYFDSLPYGFSKSQIAPLNSLIFNFSADPNGKDNNPDVPVTLWGRANLSFTLNSPIPIVGAEFGPRFDYDKLSLLVGPELQIQTLVPTSPFNTSQYSTLWYAFLAKLSYDGGFIVPKIEGKVMSTEKTKISDSEGLETDIDHTATWRVSPEIEAHLPLGLRANVGLDAYWFGVTGVASKTFAYSIGKSTLLRYRVGVGLQSGAWEGWFHYYWVTHVSDLDAHYYQAPYLFEEYTLAAQFASLEVKWKF